MPLGVRGSAANIGALRLAQRAKKLEAAYARAESNSELLLSLIKDVEDELLAVIAHINAMAIEKQNVKLNNDVVDLATEIDELRLLLAASDTDAIDKYHQIHIALAEHFDTNSIEQLVGYIDEYEFDDALALLETLVDENITGPIQDNNK